MTIMGGDAPSKNIHHGGTETRTKASSGESQEQQQNFLRVSVTPWWICGAISQISFCLEQFGIQQRCPRGTANRIV
jgi:hypothetical protein